MTLRLRPLRDLRSGQAPRPIVTLLTDFGAGSGYPAQMKGVVLAALPDVQLVDVSHDVPAYDVLAGALLLEACVPRFPPQAVHLGVVDPGVGTARRPLCVVDGVGRRLVGPDNGLFTPFLEGGRAFVLSDPRHVPAPASATFHGRDLFAPVAAFLAGGGAPEALGPEVRDALRLPWPGAVREGDLVAGTCMAADRFGNVLTSIRAEDLAGAAPVSAEVAGAAARWVRTFGEGAPGELVALLGSGGRVEIAVREGSAAARGIARGAEVVVRLRREPPVDSPHRPATLG
ncbi:MAG TPA: SAM-dependent chlorinase/fluorinase [Anaeromyxobacteraceae bacterium]|nr:SAM-dependent chlorinase/fluorinase [Anaeromyxobacteraceae bacterium]